MKSWIRRAFVSVVVGVFVAMASAASAGTATAQLASTPYMGWNTWYGLGPSYDESTVKSVANAMLADGLAQAGYRVVWLDAGWSTGARDVLGQLTVDSAKWPDGMAGLTNWLHQRGLEAGMYTDAGATGCNGTGVGSYGHYQQDANTFAAWGFDAVKVDFCGAGQEGFTPQSLYASFAQAVSNNSSGRAMIFNVCNFWTPGQIDGTRPSAADSSWANYQWSPQIAQSWRTDTDIGFGGGRGIVFQNVLRNLDGDAAHPEAAGPGHWNDPDYLGPELGMTTAQAQAQLSMWAMVAAPLVLGSDPRALSPASISMLENPQAIGIDQDPLGAQGKVVQQLGDAQVWSKPLSNGDRAVALLNRGTSTLQMTTNAWDVGLPPTGNYAIDNVWQGSAGSTTGEISASVPPTSVALFRVAALPPAAWHTLRLSVGGSGSGKVTSDPGGLWCPGTCSATVGQGVPITLTPATEPGSRFAGWSGGGCSGTAACVVTMGSDQAVTATFTALHTLNVSRMGSGKGTVTSDPAGIACPTACSAVFDQSAPLTLKAKATSGSAFAGWSGAGCSRAGSCVERLGSDQTLKARFEGSTGLDPPIPTSTGVQDTVWCAAPPGRSCTFTETLTTVETVAGSKVLTIRGARKPMPNAKTVLVGRKSVKVGGGHAITFAIELNGTGRQLLKQFGNVPLTFRIQLLRKGKLVTLLNRKLTIKPKKANKKASSAPKKVSRGPERPSNRPVLRAIRLDWPVL